MKRSQIFRFFVSISAATLLACSQASACDLCSIYSAVDALEPTPNTFRFGVAEQFTSFDKLQDGGHKVANTAHQHMQSSITQAYGAYALTKQLSFQANLPYINRRYKRAEGEGIQTGTVAGIGDLSLLVKYIPLENREGDWIYFVQTFAGLKLPTGDSHELGEEGGEEHDEGEGQEHQDAHQKIHGGVEHEDAVPSAIHGHDLALGSGSWDFPLGVNFYVQSDRTYFSGNVQYIIRTEGSYNYTYANDLLWDVGPAYYVALDHDYSVALKANLSGEYKGQDSVSGAKETSTSINSLFLGPQLVVTAGDFAGELGWDIPLDIDNGGLQAVVGYRLRGAVTYKF